MSNIFLDYCSFREITSPIESERFATVPVSFYQGPDTKPRSLKTKSQTSRACEQFY
jgi:hypothetical protein